MKLPIADYMPDLPANNTQGGSGYIVNLFPKTSESWGPINSLNPYSSNALTGTCLGAFAAIDSGANNYIFAGDATSLYKLSPGSTSFSALNTTYTVATGEKWNFAQYGNRVIAAGWGNALQSFVMGTDTAFSNLAAAAPQARYIATVRDWVMAANTYDATNGNQPQRVQWCAIDDPTTWPAAGSNSEAQLLAGSQIIPGEQGWIQGIVGNLGTADAAVFFERAIWRVVYQGSPTVFGFYPAEGVRGTPAPKSIVQLGSMAYYLGEDGFYAFDGTNSKPIGLNRVDRTFFETVNQSYMYNVIGAVDPINKLVMWVYPGTGATAGVPNSMLVYNWAYDKWGFAEFSSEYIFRALSQGYSLESLNSFGTLDSLPYSLDSRVWTGGNIVIGAFGPQNKLHYFTGTALDATAETVEVEPYGESDPGRRAFVNNSRPLVDGGTPTVSIGARSRWLDSPTYTSAQPIGVDGDCPVRADGRYIRVRIAVSGDFTHLSGCHISTSPSGKK